AVVPGGLDHSRSPRRLAAEDQPFPDTDIGLSAELSRIIDDHAAMEERTAELESELQARYRDELSRAEAEHVQQLRQELQVHQRQAEQLAEDRRQQAVGFVETANAQVAQEALVRDAALRDELRGYEVSLEESAAADAVAQRARAAEEIAAHFRAVCQHEARLEIDARDRAFTELGEKVERDAAENYLAVRAEAQREVLVARQAVDQQVAALQGEVAIASASAARAEGMQQAEVAAARDGFRRLRHQQEVGDAEIVQFKREVDELSDELDTRNHELELWSEQGLDAQARFDSEAEQLREANEHMLEFSSQANTYIEGLAGVIENLEDSLAAETRMRGEESALAERRGLELRREAEIARAAAVRPGLPQLVVPGSAASLGAAALAAVPAAGGGGCPARAAVPAGALAAPFDRRVVSAITAGGYRIGDGTARAGPSTAPPAAPISLVTPDPARRAGLPTNPAAPVMFSLDSDSENEDEAFMRRRAPVKEMKLEALPTAHGLRKWVNDLVSEACRCSNRSKTRTLKYLREVFFATDVETLETDFGLGVGREVQLYQERCAREIRPFGGRPVLYMILKRYEVNFGQALHVDLSTIQALKFSGDLEAYLDALDSRLSIMMKEPDEALLLAIVVPELRQCPDLALEFQIFDRATPGSNEQTFKYLYDAARALCARKRQQKTADNLTAPPKKVQPLAKVKAKAEAKTKAEPKVKADARAGAANQEPKQFPCALWRAGACKFDRDCKFMHYKNKVRTPTAGYPAGAVVKLGGQPGDDCRHAAKPSECPFGDRCIYRHGPDDKRDIENIIKEKASKKGGGKGKKKVLLASAPCVGAGLDDFTGEIWALDSGSALDATGHVAGAKPHKISQPGAIDTGKGESRIDSAVMTHLDELGEDIEVWCDRDYVPHLVTSSRPAGPAARKVLVGTATGDGSEGPPTPPTELATLPTELADVAALSPEPEEIAGMDREEPPLFEQFFESPIPEHDVAAVAGELGAPLVEQESVGDVVRVLEGGLTDFDADAMSDPTVFQKIEVSESPDEVVLDSGAAHLTIEHLSRHTPSMPDACPGCRAGKHCKPHSRRRDPASRGIAIQAPDAEERPFGACVHLDHAVMPHGSPAAEVAKVSLNMLDERTQYGGVFPSSSRKAEVVIAAHHLFDDVSPQIRRWWTDNAPEFKTASRKFRELHPFAHFCSIPHVPQSNGIIERFNRTLLEGALALLAMAAFPVTWWPLALTMWCMMHNGFKIGKDGFTPYFRRFGRHPEFRQYPFGALVFVAPREKGVKQPKWQEKMLPYVLVGIGIGPCFDWNKTYAVVPLRRLLGDYRPSRSSIRYSAEVFFPERVTFPAKQRLRLAGAARDDAFPAPAVCDEKGAWDIEESDHSAGSGNECDGELAENAPKLVPGNFVEDIVLGPENLADSGGDQDDWLGADAKFIAEDVLAGMGPEPEPLDEAEVKAAGGRPPTGWRIDTFGSRAVSVPPWSRRPPTVYPEAWVMMSKGDQNKLRDEWKEKDPDGFKKQVPLRSRRRHGPGVGDPGRLGQHGQRMPPNSLTNNQKQFQHLGVQRRCFRQCIGTCGALRADLLKCARAKIRSGAFTAIFLEINCEMDSVLSQGVVPGTLAIRLAEETDLTLKETRRALHGVVREAYLNGCAIYVWASTPSTAGSPRQHVDAGPGGACGDVDLSDKLIQTTISICRHAARYGGWIFWERPPTSKFWHRQDVIDFAQYLDAGSRDVSTAALGMKFVVKRGGQEIEQYLKQKWRIMSNHADFLRRLEPYQDVPDLPEDSFIECTGKIAKDSANYTRELAEVFWSIVKVVPSLDHRDDGVDAEPPVWSCLITRKINLKSAEARSEAALKAIEKELAGHRSRQTWSETEVREYKDLMKDPTIPEVLHGRVFGIMGEKNAEGDDASIKFRAVFQGSQVRTKTGVDAVDLYQEVSSSPVSFAAVRCTLAIAVLLQLQVSVCDALQAYLQASISGPGRVPAWVEIPREWWPSSWYHNGDRSRPRFVRPVCLLLRALYGHPEAGALWEHLFEGILKALHWKPVASWPGVFLHPDGSILNVCVDDVLL
ncbi:unnamed protein product, partial [Prorocentrum cordatum]